ncbi:HsdM family class I SAM-dependent methyltransferase [Alkalitalea saponilacus]|uniref:site-specific DNA-methyltransferase (adenine-specific) n=1 Tax=Alkalitalea saponilacus TaxID=889453 RepID=A0A1T5HU94_9BACT|nr:N-6 DNA methylase [Alkalitalea saponilacus]ASB50358.1 SAM-dependent methyltransferase [Alkalitalea saponilacus]SKC24242.1 N-6 DNA Methylase [Alkalitalea saponilacus]
MSTQLFEQHIIDLNFSLLDDNKKSGVLLTNNFENLDSNLASPDILFALETAKNKFQADAVYFRHFQDGRAYVPQLYLFDYTQKGISDEDKNKIHIQMWNGYQVPAYIIIEQSSVSIFDSRKRPKEEKDSYAKEILTRTGEAIKDFNGKDFDSGIFWDEQNEKKDFRFEQSATRDLIRGLKEVFRSFLEESGLNRHVALKLLVQSLLIKYLEERDVKSASGYFAGTYFKKNFQCSDFCETIRKGKLLNLLDQLAKDFNGKIFEWDKEKEFKEREAIQQSEVQNLANYLDGNIKNNQFVIWRLYSFTHLPVEVISSVYEELLTDSKDIVYTPEMIVSTLVDECMPLKIPHEDFKIIDVSCGSGIFLVKTYKRIVQWWRYEQWKKTGKLIRPSLSVLKELLLQSIHGVDIEQDAIRLSVFSLALAILDEVDLDPPTWGKLKFPDLSKNIITQDFFEFIVSKPNANFDLVIGNPPFNLASVNGKEPSRIKHFKELKDKKGYESEINIPDENPALHFLVHSMKLLKENAILCLVQPSVPLLYKKDITFRAELFSNYNLLQVIDLTKLANKLWGSRTVATAAVFMQKCLPTDEDVLHLVANRTFSNSNRLFLEFDHYDFHLVSKNAVLNNTYVWKANLLGGGRINNLLERLSELKTLKHFIESKKIEGWLSGEGFTENRNGKPCKYITGKKFIPASAMFENEVDITQLVECNIDKFERRRNELIYTPPHILIRANIGKEGLITHFSDEYLVFRNKIIGIHAPEKHRSELEQLFHYLKNNGKVLRFFILATSSQIKVNRHTVPMTEDFMDLPFSENEDDLKISETEEIIIDDVLNNQLAKNDLSAYSSEGEISNFSNLFCKTLNSIYQKEKSFQLFKIIDAGKYFALHFEYASEKLHAKFENADDIEKYIESVIPSRKENNESTHIQKIIKVYGQDSIILAKPKQLRYWLSSIALRDADETFADYVKSRYHNA